MPVVTRSARKSSPFMVSPYNFSANRRRGRSAARRQLRYETIPSTIRGYRVAQRQEPRLEVGFSPGRGSAKRAVTASNLTATTFAALTFDTETNQQANITLLPRGTAINQRERDIVHCYGFRIQGIVGNLKNTEKLCFHYAIISPKDSAAPESTNFLRDYSSARAKDFVPTELTGLELHFNPINADRYTVFTHKRLWIHPQDTGVPNTGNELYSGSNGQGMVPFQHYVKIDRQLRYSGSVDTADTPMYIVYWASYPFKLKATAAGSDGCQLSYRVIMDFKEPS